MVNLPNNSAAILEVREGRSAPKLPILRAGETDEGCKLIGLDPAKGTATVQIGEASETLTLDMGTGKAPHQNGTLNFHETSLRQVIEVYQELTGRTVVHSPILVHSAIYLQSVPNLSPGDCASAIEKVLRTNGTLIKVRGDKFAFAIRPTQEKVVGLIPDPPLGAANSNDESFAPGLIKFVNADVLRILEIYSELSGRTILRPNAEPPFKVTMKTQSSMTRSEALWLNEAAMALGGLTIVRTGDKFAYAVPTERARSIPAIDLTAVEAKIKKASAPEHIRIDEGDVQRLLDTYSETLGREALPVPPEVPKTEFALRTQAPLTVVERAFALEAVAALNYLAFDLVGPDHVAIRHSSTAPRSAK